MKIAACYIRVSTSEQTEYSPESQLRMIKEYALKNNYFVSSEYIYRDEGVSGRTAEKRPAFQQMISAAKQKPQPFDTILIYSTSRFARNHEQSIVYRSMLERECGIEVVSITQPSVDKKTDMLTSAIYSIIDEWYSLDLSENVKRGMTQKALNGETQTSPPFGYDLKHRGGIFTINEEEAKAVRFIFDEFLKGTSKWYIAKKLNAMGTKTKRGCAITTGSVRYILRNVAYKGYSRWTPTERVYWDFKNPNTLIVKSKHEPIIDEATFDLVQEKLDALEQTKSKKERPVETHKHWLSGMIKCASCGSKLNYSGAIPNGQKAHFRCGGYGKGHCEDMNYITVKQAEHLISAYLYKVFDNIDILHDANIKNLSNSVSEMDILNKEAKNLEGKLERAKNAFLNGVFELAEYKELKSSIEAELSRTRNSLAQFDKPVSYANLQKNIKSTYNILVDPSFNKDEKSKAVRDIIDSIIFDKKSGLFQINFYN